MFLQWAWETISKLRLHALDQEDAVSIAAVQGEREGFERMLDFDLEATILDSIVRGVTAKNPLACYVALQTTQLGHSVPEICTRGLEYLKVLLVSGRYDHVMECHVNITPLFFPVPDALLGDENFYGVLQSILTADSTVLKMAKELVITDGPGPVIKEFCGMILKQIASFKR